jgi:acyl-coenzyme A thioesterase PaaI-like protein
VLRPLSNTFGFSSNCFVCEPTNNAGLRLQFFHDDERGLVTARYTFGPQHSGAPLLVHGGVIAAVCDDAMAWAAIAIGHYFALTAETRLSYLTPVPIEREVTIRGRLIGRVGKQMWLTADVRLADTVHVRAESRATVVGEELAAGAGIPTDAQPIDRD